MTPKAQADAAARDLRERVAKCEACGCTDQRHLVCHEILRGPLRRLARGVPCACLVLCDEWANNCHLMVSRMSWEKQLAILWRSRRSDMDLLEFWKIAGRRKPLPEELLAEVSR